MAKSKKIKGVDWDARAFASVEKNAALIKRLFAVLVRDAVAIAAVVKNPREPFRFDDYPNLRERVNKLFGKFASSLKMHIDKSSAELWGLSNKKNDALLDDYAHAVSMAKVIRELFREPATSQALQAFQQRTEAGLNLSQRVWKITEQAKSEIEQAFDGGIQQGKSAAEISRDIRNHLHEPERLFRRVRDEAGNLVLSKAAREYHPGQGVYRSSYKNAMRLARTEPNMAYRTADDIRWNSLDFVIGTEIRLSNNPNHCPMCERLAGVYPKSFKWRGWHAQCRCFRIPKLMEHKDYDRLELKLLNGEDTTDLKAKGEVTAMPKNFKEWLNTNADKLSGRKSMPFFITDNAEYLRI